MPVDAMHQRPGAIARATRVTLDPEAPQRTRASRLLHRVGGVTSTATASVLVCVAVATFMVALVVADYPSSWEAGFSTVSAGITLIMVFVIQHTQSRQQLATQLKLDELIRSSPRADDRLVHIEASGDDELLEHGERQAEHHALLRTDRPVEPDEAFARD